MSATTTIIGNTTAAVELRFTPGGKAVANFTVASSDRYLDKNTQQWKDGETLFQRCNLWGPDAENLAESDLAPGTRVIVTGRLKARSYETREGEKRTVTELEVTELGVSTKYATVKATKSNRSGNGGGGQAGGNQWPTSHNSSGDSEPPF